MSKLVRAISENGGVVVAAIDSTDIVNEMERLHKPCAVCTAALGRILTAACLMGANLKDTEDVLTVKFKGDGPAGQAVAVINGSGDVKGYMDNYYVDVPDRADGKLNVGAAIGHSGNLYVIKDLGMKEPYLGQIELVSGEIAEDITSYYAISEQTPNVCALGVLVNTDLTVKRAGGYLLQLLPGATDEEITRLEENIKNMKSVTQLLSEGKTAEEIALMTMQGFNPNLLDSQEMRYKCGCSKESIEKALISIGRKDLESLRDEEDMLEVCCQYCDKKYNMRASDLLKKIKN